MLVTSIPFSNGWTVLVDGEEVEKEKVNVGFIGVPLEAGEQVIEFVYDTPFLKIGLLGTMIGIAGVTILHYRRRKLN